MYFKQDTNRKVNFSGKVKLVVSDIDGTFLEPDKSVPQSSIQAVKLLKQHNIPFAFATGRMYAAIQGWVEQLELDTPQIAGNGAQIVDPITNQELCHYYFTHKEIVWIVQFAKANNIVPVFFSSSDVTSTKLAETDMFLARNNEFVQEKPEDFFVDPKKQFDKILFLSMEDDIPKLQQQAQALIELAKAENINIQTVFSEPNIFNLVPSQATKSSAIKTLCKHVNCTIHDVMAIGDGENDADMLASVGLGVAMGNAEQITKDAALAITLDNLNGGLLNAIQHIIMNAEL